MKPEPPSSSVAEAVLDVLRRFHKLSIGIVLVERPGHDPAWRIDASDAAGQRWTVEHEDYGRAAVLLAELVGVELEE